MAEAKRQKSVAQLLLNAAMQDQAACKLLAHGADIGDAMEARYGTIDPDGLDRQYVLQVVQEIVIWAKLQLAQVSKPTP